MSFCQKSWAEGVKISLKIHMLPLLILPGKQRLKSLVDVFPWEKSMGIGRYVIPFSGDIRYFVRLCLD